MEEEKVKIDEANLAEYGAEVNFEYGMEAGIADVPQNLSPRSEEETEKG